MRLWMKSRYEGLQTRLKNIDSDGCHFLVLMSIAEEVNGSDIDLVDAVNTCFEHQLIDGNYYVKDALSLLAILTGKSWVREEYKELPDEIGEHEYTEAVYYNPRTGYRHFRRRGFDTLVNSVTVAEGHVEKYYLYRWS